MQIPRELYNEGGISSVPLRRENFGLGSKFKKFVRKIIPKEVAQVAVKAAPFVAPFNPAIAGAMSGLGTFQQTGRMGKSLTAGALNYGGGQAARYLGGAGFQGNPFTGGGAFTPSGFMGGFSSPLGTETGLGKFLQDRRIARQPMGDQFANARQAMTGNQAYTGGTYQDSIMTGGVGTKAGTIPQAPQIWSPGIQHSGAPQFPNQPPPSILSQQQARPYQDRIMRTASGVEPRQDLKAIEQVLQGGEPYQDRIMNKELMDITKGAAETSQEGLGSRIVEKVKSMNPLSKDFDFAKAGDTIKDLGGKALNAVFRDKDGNLDKAAILAALVTVPTFFEARALADEAGLSEGEFTEDMFTAAKADSKQTYEANLGSFFEGTGYTGNLAKGGLIRRNYAFGPDPDEFPEDDDLTIFEIIKEQGIPVGEQVKGKIKQGAKSILMAEGTGLSPEQEAMIDGMLQKGADTDTISSITGASPDQIKIYLQTQKKKLSKGGRIGFSNGANLEQKLKDLADYYMQRGLSESEAYETAANKLYKKDGGRIGFGEGTENPYKYGTVDYYKWWLDEGSTADSETEYMGGFTLTHEMDLIKNLEEAGGDATVYKDNLQKKINENAEWFQSLSPEKQKEEKEYLNKEFKKDYDMGIMPGQGEWWGKDVIREKIDEGKSNPYEPFYKEAKHGGIMRKGYALGTTMPLPREGGLGGLPVEADMRYTGGFMPYGEKEKADDVPARLSKNEFVFTADAVRAAGGGSMQKGAQRMYNTMKMLEGQMA